MTIAKWRKKQSRACEALKEVLKIRELHKQPKNKEKIDFTYQPKKKPKK